jgi:hypothetical protein
LIFISGPQRAQAPFPGGVAFSAYISARNTEISKDFTIKFDNVVTNIGNHYNPLVGLFIAPEHGVYVFSWNLFCFAPDYIYSHIVVNSNVVGGTDTSGMGAQDVRSTTGIVAVEVNQGDLVFVRTHPLNGHAPYIISGPDLRSSFTGWKLF